jgi:hypothetical protein
MTPTQRQTLEMELATIDRRRAELEMVLSTLPPDTHHCCDPRREEFEAELSSLWQHRQEIAEELYPRPQDA